MKHRQTFGESLRLRCCHDGLHFVIFSCFGIFWNHKSNFDASERNQRFCFFVNKNEIQRARIYSLKPEQTDPWNCLSKEVGIVQWYKPSYKLHRNLDTEKKSDKIQTIIEESYATVLYIPSSVGYPMSMHVNCIYVLCKWCSLLCMAWGSSETIS